MDSDEGLSCDPLALILSFTSHADACALILTADTESTELKGKYLGASYDAPFSQCERRKCSSCPNNTSCQCLNIVVQFLMLWKYIFEFVIGKKREIYLKQTKFIQH